MKTLTDAQAKMLRSLVGQGEAARKYPWAYSPGLAIGTIGCHKAVAESLVRAKLVDVTPHWSGLKIIDINATGRAALSLVEEVQA